MSWCLHRLPHSLREKASKETLADKPKRSRKQRRLHSVSKLRRFLAKRMHSITFPFCEPAPGQSLTIPYSNNQKLLRYAHRCVDGSAVVFDRSHLVYFVLLIAHFPGSDTTGTGTNQLVDHIKSRLSTHGLYANVIVLDTVRILLVCSPFDELSALELMRFPGVSVEKLPQVSSIQLLGHHVSGFIQRRVWPAKDYALRILQGKNNNAFAAAIEDFFTAENSPSDQAFFVCAANFATFRLLCLRSHPEWKSSRNAAKFSLYGTELSNDTDAVSLMNLRQDIATIYLEHLARRDVSAPEEFCSTTAGNGVSGRIQSSLRTDDLGVPIEAANEALSAKLTSESSTSPYWRSEFSDLSHAVPFLSSFMLEETVSTADASIPIMVHCSKLSAWPKPIPVASIYLPRCVAHTLLRGFVMDGAPLLGTKEMQYISLERHLLAYPFSAFCSSSAHKLNMFFVRQCLTRWLEKPWNRRPDFEAGTLWNSLCYILVSSGKKEALHASLSAFEDSLRAILHEEQTRSNNKVISNKSKKLAFHQWLSFPTDVLLARMDCQERSASEAMTVPSDRAKQLNALSSLVKDVALTPLHLSLLSHFSQLFLTTNTRCDYGDMVVSGDAPTDDPIGVVIYCSYSLALGRPCSLICILSDHVETANRTFIHVRRRKQSVPALDAFQCNENLLL